MKDWILRIAKLLLLVLLAAGGLLVVKGTARQVDFGKLQADVEKAMDLSDMKQGDARMLRRFYDLNAGELAHWVLYTASDNMAVEELLLVECASPEQAEQVLEAARNRKETQVKNFEGYGPEQVQLLNGCVIRRDGSYVLFAVSDRVSDIKKAYRKDLFQTERTGS
ncbi:DUF4358 domain-containing protein [Anaerosacchariphilus sp. NSJ-68]|uniref:DUF4358 domain-containing protein n=2 Tax=Lachnospiraceae TaxID=186803 RepID=A0A923LE11_9FIRM|nr:MULTISPECIES: DUF4358 domain-containing protein [Lachnospiraceae]MBC5660936.1 DUF4358 domain-containing protein [Anaerosacchariphilus hominis]MBC5699594.1 DUF4358 domain-containing protein [Roseburia difficilis]